MTTENFVNDENVALFDIDDNKCLNLKIYSSKPEILLQDFWRFKINHWIENIENNEIYFKKISILNIKEIINSFPDREINFSKNISDELSKYLIEKEMYLEERSRVGLSIKQKDACILDKFELYKQTLDTLMIRHLRPKQMWDSFFMYVMKKSANFSVPGSGKTSSALGVYAMLKHEKKVNKIVVVGPKNCFVSWKDEYKACFGNKKVNIFDVQDDGLGSKYIKNHLINSDNYELFLFNYESLNNYRDNLKKIISSNTLLVFDEIHKVKKYGGKRALDALYISSEAKYTIAMTGTPIPNSYADIYNLLNVLYQNDYNDFFNFSYNQLSKIDSLDADEVNEKINPFFCRTTKKDLNVPEAEKDHIEKSFASDEENKVFSFIWNAYKDKSYFLFYIRLMQLESNPEHLKHAITEEDVKDCYFDDEDMNIFSKEKDTFQLTNEIKEIVNKISGSSKKQKCIDLIKKLIFENKKVLLWCIFINTIHFFERTLKSFGIKVGIIYGNVSPDERERILNDFKNGDLQVLISNPHTLAESVSLHKNCHDAIYFEYSFNLVHLLQSKDRIHRLGLPDGQYTQWYYMQQVYTVNNNNYSLGESIYHRLLEKEQTMLNAIDKNILEKPSTTEEDLKIIFKDFFTNKQL